MSSRQKPESWRSVTLKPDQTLDPAQIAGPLTVLRVANNTSLVALPEGVSADVIHAENCARLLSIGRQIACRKLIVDGSAISAIPADLSVTFLLSARGCQRLKRLPRGFSTGSLNLQGCVALEELPEGLSVVSLDIGGCAAIKALPDDLELRGGGLSLRDCALIECIPALSGDIAFLDISGCPKIVSIPTSLRITSWIDVAGSGLRELPPHLARLRLRWRGVPVDERVAFRPETLSIGEILTERNAELRRVMIERFGFERFMSEARAEVLDRDCDAGGERRLLRVPMENDEPIVCVSVFCPSTDRQFFLRVPPTMTNCRSAIAWTAGFDDPGEYAPLIET
jgi:hypothetical protein